MSNVVLVSYLDDDNRHIWQIFVEHGEKLLRIGGSDALSASEMQGFELPDEIPYCMTVSVLLPEVAYDWLEKDVVCCTMH